MIEGNLASGSKSGHQTGDAKSSPENAKHTGLMELIRNRERAELLMMTEIRNAKSEILLASSSLGYLDHLESLGLLDMLERAKSHGVRTLILCPDPFEKTDTADYKAYPMLVSEIKRYAEIRDVSGQINGTILIVDDSRVLSISEEGLNALAIYSDNRSLLNNFSSLFEALWVERELIQDLIRSKNELLQYNEKLKMHDKMQQEFINIAAHELRTPIQPILGMRELIESRLTHDKQSIEISREDLAIIFRNASRLQKLSEDILSVARIESNALNVQRVSFDIAELVSLLVEDYRHSMGKKIGLNYLPQSNDLQPAEPVLVNADREKISQVVSNFLDNAIKFTEEGSITVRVSENQEANEAIVTIMDTGKGIDPEVFSKLFTKFGVKSDKGTGLGLFISKKIIEAHGGRVWGMNNKNEKGATFGFSLPLNDPTLRDKSHMQVEINQSRS